MTHPLDALFRPRSVAVVGASSAPEKYGYIILKNILDAGFGGPIYPVNPKAGEILGLPCRPRVADLPPDVDLVVIIIPARAVPQAVAECGERGIKVAVVISGGFAESGEEGARLQHEVVEAARRSGIRVLGPNCQGVNSPHHRLCASWPLLTRRGEIALISQSGTVGAALMDWASEEQLGCSAFVSLGNRADVDETDLIEYLAQDAHTRVIGLYLEGIKDLERFRRRAGACPKPIVILKSGRTTEGRRAAASHTGSLAGRDELYSALFRQLRITQGPLVVEARSATATGLNFENSDWTLSGQVRITVPDGKLTSSDAKVAFRNNQIASAQVRGAPAEFEQRVKETGQLARGRANSIDYDVQAATVRLDGDAWLTDGTNVIRGSTLVYDIARQRVAANPGGQEPGGVRITINPKSQPKPGDKPKEKPASEPSAPDTPR